MSGRLGIRIGGLALKNPLICGSGEHLIEAAGIRRALAEGAAAVVVKSTNESEAARRQLALTDYALLDSRWRRLPWDFAPPADAQLLCRSGLTPQPFEAWLEMAVRLDREARATDAYLVPSIVLASLEDCVAMARRIEEAGLRLIEVNVGAPHGPEAAGGAISLLRAPERVREVAAAIRAAVSLPLWIKLTGQSEDVVGLAEAAKEGGADAVTVMGRFLAVLPDLDTLAPVLGTSAAFGGPWALPLTCRWLALARRRLGAEFPLIATNGARDGLDIARFLLAGASAVQMTSAILTGGFATIGAALEELASYLESKGLDARDLIGRAADGLARYEDQAPRPDHWRKFVPPDAVD